MEDQKSDLFFNSVNEKSVMTKNFTEEKNWLVFYSSCHSQMIPSQKDISEAKTKGYLMKTRPNKEISRHYCVLLNGVFFFYQNRKAFKAGMLENSLQITNWYLVVSQQKSGRNMMMFQIVLARNDKILLLATPDKKIFKNFIRGIERFSIRLSVETEYKSLGSAQSMVKKEFILLKNEQRNTRSIGQFLSKSSLKDQDSISWFVFQIAMLRKFQHPNILSLHQVYEEKNCFVLVYEEWKPTADSVSLYYLLQTCKKLDEIVALKVLEGILFALEYLHNQERILHNYLREENVLISSVDDRLEIKLFNFKHAQRISSTKQLNLGSFGGHVSPELVHFQNLVVTSTLDMYSVGLLLLKMVSGISYENLVMNNYRVKLSWQAGLSIEVSELIEGLLELNPIKRMTRKRAEEIVKGKLESLLKSSKDILLINNRIKAQIKAISKVALNMTFQGGTKLNSYLMGSESKSSLPVPQSIDEDEKESISIMCKDTLGPDQKPKSQVSHMASIIMPSIIQEFESFNEEQSSIRREMTLVQKEKTELDPFVRSSKTAGNDIAFFSRRMSSNDISGDVDKLEESYLNIEKKERLSTKMDVLQKSERKKKFILSLRMLPLS